MRSVVITTIFSSTFGVITAIFLNVVGALSVQADTAVPVLQGFYGQGEANDYFGKPMQGTKNQGFTLELTKSGPQVAERKPKVAPEQKQVADTFKENPVPEEPTEQVETKEAVPQTPEEKRAAIISKFGDPLKEAPLRTQETAPAPFRGMMQALEAGDDELAAQYARQLVRYKQKLKTLIGRQVGIETKMMQREDIVDASDRYPEENWVLDVKFPDEEEAKLENGNSYLDEEARKLIEKEMKRAENYDLFNNKQGQVSLSDSLDEKTERAKARQLLKGRVPTAPGGDVDIYFYFRVQDKDTKAIAPEIEKLYQETKKSNNKVHLIALTIDSYDASRINSFKKEARVTFPIIPGTEAARTQGITKSPTVTFVAAKSGRAYSEEGPRSFFFYSEVLNLMKGNVK